MKKSILAFLFLSMIISCRKEPFQQIKEDVLISKTKAYLSKSLSQYDFQSADFSRSLISKYDSGRAMVRVPFRNKGLSENFIAVKFKNENIEKGRIITLSRFTELATAVSRTHTFNGQISITTLNRNQIFQSEIKEGFVTAWQTKSSQDVLKADVEADPYKELPEVVVVGYIPTSGGISWSIWLNLLSIMDSGGNMYWGNNYYDSTDPSSGGNGGGGGGSSYVSPLQIDFENQFDMAAIDIEKFAKCFTNIMDAGATGSIEIFTDIPVDGDPTKFFDWSNGSPGHVFLQIKKENGTQSVTQNIGFYPESGWKTSLTPAPIKGKFVDNAQHEFNASYKVNLTSAQLQRAVTRILYLNRFIKYDIDDYNCTDWALEIFNETVDVDKRLEIPRYDIPGGMAPYGTNTPQGLYQKLQHLKQVGGQAAANITIPLIGWVGMSSGPCN